jgi:hypothetical protein
MQLNQPVATSAAMAILPDVQSQRKTTRAFSGTQVYKGVFSGY